jgi:glycolate oxidase
LAVNFSAITESILRELVSICGEGYVSSVPAVMEPYSHDYTEDLRFLPEVVVKPANAQEVSAVMKVCNTHFIPLTPAGARTGLSGGALAVYGGVVLSLERMNQILEIDTRNLQATVQPGVITEVFQNAVAEKGLFYPVDPASRGSCFIGGNLATSSGGMRAVKYGLTRDYVLELEVVLPSGEIIHTGARTIKNSTGYNLTQLLVGSEGTLGIITRATFKLTVQPLHRLLMLFSFTDGEKACEVVSAIFHARLHPSAIEFVEKDAIDLAQEYLGHKEIETQGVEAFLLVELDGNHPDVLAKESEQLFAVAEAGGCGETLFMDAPEQMARIWKIRRAIGEATRAKQLVKEEDTCVPRAELPKLWRKVKSLAAAAGFPVYCFGHAGDGNLHVHIIKSRNATAEEMDRLDRLVREILTFTVSLGGTISGEHGIGIVQRPYMDVKFKPHELNLLRGIKQLFDPKGILNPGKVLPD